MSRYNEIMDHIEMTDEMRERILTNIHAMKKRKRIHLRKHTEWAIAIGNYGISERRDASWIWYRSRTKVNRW